MLGLFFKYQKRHILRFFERNRLAKAITVGLFGLVILGLMSGLYSFFKAGFYYIVSFPYFQSSVLLYSYELFFALVALLVVLSSFITLAYRLFRGRSDHWIISSPAYLVMPRFVFWRGYLQSLWPLVVLALPVLAAVSQVFSLSGPGFVAVIASILFLTLFLTSLVFFLLLGLGRMLMLVKNDTSWLRLSRLMLVLVIGLAVVGWLGWQQSVDKDLISLFQARDLASQEVDTDRVSQLFFYYPSHWTALALHHWQAGRVAAGSWALAIMASLSLLMYVAYRLSLRWFLSVWQKLQEGGVTAETGTDRQTGKKAAPWRFGSRPVPALFKKELLTATRDSQALLWFLFLLGLWVFQAGLNVVLGRMTAGYYPSGSDVLVTIQVLQFVTAIYFVSAFVLRFVFPAFSAEKRTAWILASAPVDQARAYWAKLCFYTPLLLLVGLCLSLLNLLVLGVSFWAGWAYLVVLATSLILLVIFGLSMGAIFPNFSTDDPSDLSTTLPGLVLIVSSLAYGALGGWVFYQVMQAGDLGYFFGFELLSLVLIGLFVWQAPKYLKQQEFVKIKS